MVTRLITLLIAVGLVTACGGETALRGAAEAKTPAGERAQRRAYDGAPPVIPHENFGMTCTECHDLQGVEVTDVGFSPPSPHDKTMGMSAISNCRQCHVFSGDAAVFAANDFVGLPQDLRRGQRLSDFSPPVIPHKTFMRENCVACHSGQAAREEIRTTHPERTNCGQCHVGQVATATFGDIPL